jgi:hypothetical protein
MSDVQQLPDNHMFERAWSIQEAIHPRAEHLSGARGEFGSERTSVLGARAHRPALFSLTTVPSKRRP